MCCCYVRSGQRSIDFKRHANTWTPKDGHAALIDKRVEDILKYRWCCDSVVGCSIQ